MNRVFPEITIRNSVFFRYEQEVYCPNTLNLSKMKKIFFVVFALISIIGMASCNYDDSNDIDIIIPNDSTQSNEPESDKT